MLEDFDGLKRRVMQLYKERITCDEKINKQAVEIGELREQVEARDNLNREVEQLNAANLSEYVTSIN